MPTDNTKAKINRTKGQTTIYKTTHKTKDQVKGTPLKSVLNSVLRKRQQFIFYMLTHRVTLFTIPVTSYE